jgi:hypothetical protein
VGRGSNGIRHGAIVSNRSANEVIKQGDRRSWSTILFNSFEFVFYSSGWPG